MEIRVSMIIFDVIIIIINNIPLLYGKQAKTNSENKISVVKFFLHIIKCNSHCHYNDADKAQIKNLTSSRSVY